MTLLSASSPQWSLKSRHISRVENSSSARRESTTTSKGSRRAAIASRSSAKTRAMSIPEWSVGGFRSTSGSKSAVRRSHSTRHSLNRKDRRGSWC